jgi:hypothetical protein
MERKYTILTVLIITLTVIFIVNAESCYQGNMSCYEQSSMQLSVSTMPSHDTMTVLGGKVLKGTTQSSLQNLEKVVQLSSQNCESQVVENLLKDATPTEDSYYPASPVEKGDENLSCIESEQCQELNRNMENEPEGMNSSVGIKGITSEEKEE